MSLRWFVGGFPCFFCNPRNQGKEDQGRRGSGFVVTSIFGTPQTGRLARHGILSVMAWVSAALTLRSAGMSLVGFLRHPPPLHSLILPSRQTLIHSSRHFCPNREPVQIRGCMLQCNDVVDEDEGDTRRCDSQWCCVCLNLCGKHLLQQRI